MSFFSFDRERWIPIGKDFMAGSVGGMSSMLTGHPFDTIKVMLQDGSGNVPKFKNGWQALKYTVQMDGIRGVYRGLSVPLVSVSFINSIFFVTNNHCQKLFHPNNDTLIPYHKVAAAGAIAGGTISFFLTPRDLIKSKLQVQSRNTNLLSTVTTKGEPPRQFYKGPIDVIRQIIRKDGFLGLFKGLRPTLARDIPGDMVYFTMYEFMKRKLSALSKSSGHPEHFPAWVAIGAGGCAGMSFWASIYPLDVIKTRIQTQPEPAIYKGIIHCAKEIYRKEGIATFYKGFSATILRAFPTSAVNFFMYETTKKMLNSKIDDQDLSSIGLEAT
ncbi:mitochondrial substrate carrier family protein [Heterostelium album PN500]|uniref:Mitochondrial substrate carrier family protein n=1 Tax=Heterostelium pallidum (strain ATCC 26659 / Pp 5 / PN500) TaxID=670386 RepID=D3B4B6_HETP5|nr:mitochondrial substrate carrier family protein [Heterostelium album PN500]EFA84164.1 mitochondrial substrate carrier family protein [Heterostelium album PN500]|eukprot:XP_020436281.1 mitochondrial substrate carrier family protein [Heterostelium album PN500]